MHSGKLSLFVSMRRIIFIVLILIYILIKESKPRWCFFFPHQSSLFFIHHFRSHMQRFATFQSSLSTLPLGSSLLDESTHYFPSSMFVLHQCNNCWSYCGHFQFHIHYNCLIPVIKPNSRRLSFQVLIRRRDAKLIRFQRECVFHFERGVTEELLFSCTKNKMITWEL